MVPELSAPCVNPTCVCGWEGSCASQLELNRTDLQGHHSTQQVPSGISRGRDPSSLKNMNLIPQVCTKPAK